MTHFSKFRTASVVKWVFSTFPVKHQKSSKSHFSGCRGTSFCIKMPFCYIIRSPITTEPSCKEGSLKPCSRTVRRNSLPAAQAALLDYFHCTRGLHFTDAEQISSNSPIFLRKLLKNVREEEGTRPSVAKFLRYHPINEFEAFFESLGLNPSEMSSLLPHNSMFLSNTLLANVHILCNYGIPRIKIAKIYKEAAEILGYDHGVLSLKIRAYEELGLSKTSVMKLVVSCPSVLIGDVNGEFAKLLWELKSLGIDCDWMLGCLSEKNSYAWRRMLEVLHFLKGMGYGKEELGGILARDSGFLLDGSGNTTYSLVGLFLKFGMAMDEIKRLFLLFPQVQIGNFAKNLRRSLMFLIEIEMDAGEIGKIMRTCPQLLGSCTLMKPNSVFVRLNVGKRRLCRIIKEDPNHLKGWVCGSKISRLPKAEKDQTSFMQKTEFFLSLGITENSAEMRKALKLCRGKGAELQERFDCLVKAGLKQNDVSEMVKVAPQILNRSKDLIEKKIDLLVNTVGYPLESLVGFPTFVCFTGKKVKMRFSMYNWLKDRGMTRPGLALSTIFACSDKRFNLQFVDRHPKGPEVWENIKKKISS